MPIWKRTPLMPRQYSPTIRISTEPSELRWQAPQVRAWTPTRRNWGQPCKTIPWAVSRDRNSSNNWTNITYRSMRIWINLLESMRAVTSCPSTSSASTYSASSTGPRSTIESTRSTWITPRSCHLRKLARNPSHRLRPSNRRSPGSKTISPLRLRCDTLESK